MKLTHFRQIEYFYKRVEPFLLAHEAEHNLILGICTDLMRYPELIETPLYLAVAEHDGEPVAVALMTPPNNLVLSRITQAEAIPLLAQDLRERYKSLPAVVGVTPGSRDFAALWQRLSGQSCGLAQPQGIYELNKVTPVTGVSGKMRPAAGSDHELLAQWLKAFNEEAMGISDASKIDQLVIQILNSDTQGLYLWEDGQVVSMSGFGRPTPNGIVIRYVYTPPEYRGQGYASACVASLSQTLLDSGRKYCFLYTDLANPTSNSIYKKLGYRQVGDSEMFQFGSYRGINKDFSH